MRASPEYVVASIRKELSNLIMGDLRPKTPDRETHLVNKATVKLKLQQHLLVRTMNFTKVRALIFP